MTLEPAHEPLARDTPTCLYCGRKFDLGYHYTCHICGATYCYIHMRKHARAHRIPSNRPEAPPAEPLPAPITQVATSDPDEIELIRSLMGSLGEGEGPEFLSP